ncbi:MAG: hypothetical protein ISS19_06585 [Bacteroidales bacterium]|nr:hypothetical protein [Bacteroidales bacterium]
MKNNKAIFYILLILLFTLSCAKKPGDRFVEIQWKQQHILDTGNGEPAAVFVAGHGDDLTLFSAIDSPRSKLRGNEFLSSAKPIRSQDSNP